MLHNSETGSSYKKKVECLQSGLSSYYPVLWGRNVGKEVMKDPFVFVVNEELPEFSRMDLASHLRRIDFRSTARAILARANNEDRLRGNIQMNLMFSGGENQR